jgi:hypothetical protein
MQWVLRLIATGDDAYCRSTDLAEICRPDGLRDIANLGLTLLEAKQPGSVFLTFATHFSDVATTW